MNAYRFSEFPSQYGIAENLEDEAHEAESYDILDHLSS